MKNSIKREQSQACLNFAERKNFRLKAKHKILMTLALLLTAVTGAWAQTSQLQHGECGNRFIQLYCRRELSIPC